MEGKWEEQKVREIVYSFDGICLCCGTGVHFASNMPECKCTHCGLGGVWRYRTDDLEGWYEFEWDQGEAIKKGWQPRAGFNRGPLSIQDLITKKEEKSDTR